MIIIEKSLDIDSKYFLAIIEYLRNAGGKARLVGGVVRDSLIGIKCSDIDIATDLLPGQVTEILTKQKVKVIPTGIKFGTVTAVFKGEVFEITTLRKDIDCNGRHAQVEFSKGFEEDAARRDFTINALSYCPVEHKIYDYFGGILDLEARKVVFIGDADERIKEDYLRILRFFRFSCRYAKELDANSFAACERLKGGLDALSRERIASEMDGLLKFDKSPEMLQVMNQAGILQLLFPIDSYDKQEHECVMKIAKSFDISAPLSVIYAMLFLKATDISFKKLLSLKFSRSASKEIVTLLDLQNIQEGVELFTKLKNIWLEDRAYIKYFIFASLLFPDNKSIQELYNRLSAVEVPNLPVDGNDLMKLGYSGKEIGRLLGLAKCKWVESDFALDAPKLIELIKNSDK